MPSVWMCEHGVYEMLRDVRRMRGNRRTSCACVMEWRLRRDCARTCQRARTVPNVSATRVALRFFSC